MINENTRRLENLGKRIAEQEADKNQVQQRKNEFIRLKNFKNIKIQIKIYIE